MRREIITFGETLEDCYPTENPPRNQVGGAPLNVAAMCATMGLSSHIITCLADDEGSEHVRQTLKKCGVLDDLVQENKDSVLCQTEVRVDKKTGERSFFFHKENASFLSIRVNPIWDKYFNKACLFHIGTVCLLNEEILNVQKQACQMALNAGCLISMDPNFRETLFTPESQRQNTKSFLPFVSILKLGEEEFSLLQGESLNPEAIHQFFVSYPNIKLLLVTRGKNGLTLFRPGKPPLFQESLPASRIIDTVGCGDITYGAFLSALVRHGLNQDEILSLEDSFLQKCLLFSAAAGSLECERQGALPVPTLEEIEKKIHTVR